MAHSNFDAIFGEHATSVTQLARRRPQAAHKGHAVTHRSPLKPVPLVRDHHRTEHGIGVRAFNRKIGDTYTDVLNLRHLLEVRKDQMTETSYKMFGVLLNQADEQLGKLENKPGTAAQVAELRRTQAKLKNIYSAIEAFAALGADQLGNPA
jgi:hypothetical protein